MPPLKPVYSGRASKPFWRRLNAIGLTDTVTWAGLYELGCVVQKLEEELLRRLDDAEALTKKKGR